MRTPSSLLASIVALCTSFWAVSANAGLILSVHHVDLDPDFEELLVRMQITGTEGVSSIGFDLEFPGTGVGASNLMVSVPGATTFCPTVAPGPPIAPPCTLSQLGPPNPDGTNFFLGTLGIGPTGGTYDIAYQLIELGTGFTLDATITNLVAFNNSYDSATNAITDIVIYPLVPEPTTAALLGMGLVGLVLRGRVVSPRR